MRLTRVTFTGVDESTDPSKLLALSQRYPFVEWGFLLSVANTGFEPRFPSLKYLAVVGRYNIRKAVHLCGALAVGAATGDAHHSAIGTALQLVPGASRVQINTGKGLEKHKDIYRTALHTAFNIGIEIIIQSYSFDATPLKDAAEGSAHYYRTSDDVNCGVTLLHDASGGRGVVSPFQSPINSSFTGYAGGITPENVEERLAEIFAFNPGVMPFWIDMESGVRSGDMFDMEKVEAVLDITERYIGKTRGPDLLMASPECRALPSTARGSE